MRGGGGDIATRKRPTTEAWAVGITALAMSRHLPTHDYAAVLTPGEQGAHLATHFERPSTRR